MTYQPGPSVQQAIAALRSAACASPPFAKQLNTAADALAEGRKPEGFALNAALNCLRAAAEHFGRVGMHVGRGHYLRPKITPAIDPAKAAALARVLARLEAP